MLHLSLFLPPLFFPYTKPRNLGRSFGFRPHSLLQALSVTPFVKCFFQPNLLRALALPFCKKNDITEAVSSHKPALNNSEKTPKEDTVAFRAVTLAFSGFEKRAQHLKAGDFFLNKVDHEHVQKNLFRVLQHLLQKA